MAWKTKAVREPLEEPALYDYAVGALGRRMRTVAELRRLLRGRVEKGETGETRVEQVLSRLREQRFLDDAAFAESFTRLRQEGAKWGRRRVAGDLARKGVESGLVASTVSAAYAEVDELQLAREHCARKRLRRPENDRESARILRRLVGAGFSPGTVAKLLRSWDLPEETVTAVENVELDPEPPPPEDE